MSPFLARLIRWLPFLGWPRISAATARGELWAGLTVGLMLVPQGIAYAQLAGMPPVTGIYASLLPALISVLWSASTRLGVGPTALTSLLIGASLTGLAAPGSPQWVAMAAWLALLSGALQLAIGLARAGWLFNLVSAPVLTGFTQAAAWLILASQLPTLLGSTESISEMLRGLPTVPRIHAMSTAFGVGSVVLLWTAKRWFPRFPAAIVLIAGSAGLAFATGFEAHGGAVVGTLPTGLPELGWPSALPWASFSDLLLPVLMVTLISFMETASSARVEHQQGGTHWNDNQDLIGQGLAKISAGLCGAFPTSASFSRSAINLYAGARTGWATVVSIGVVLAVLLWIAPLLRHVPQPVLAAIVVIAVFNLIQPVAIARLWHVSQVECFTACVTFALTLWTAPRMVGGVLAGLLLSMGHSLVQRLHPRIIEVGLHPDGSLRDRHLWHLEPLAPCTIGLRMDAEVDFASARSLERAVVDIVASKPAARQLCIFAQPINHVDATGLEVLDGIRNRLRKGGVDLHLSGLKLPVEHRLHRAGWVDGVDGLHIHRTDGDAIEALQRASKFAYCSALRPNDDPAAAI